MNTDVAFLHDLWEGLKPFIAKKERLSAAEALVREFDDNLDISSAEDNIEEFDATLKAALISHLDIGFEDCDEDESMIY